MITYTCLACGFIGEGEPCCCDPILIRYRKPRKKAKPQTTTDAIVAEGLRKRVGMTRKKRSGGGIGPY